MLATSPINKARNLSLGGKKSEVPDFCTVVGEAGLNNLLKALAVGVRTWVG